MITDQKPSAATPAPGAGTTAAADLVVIPPPVPAAPPVIPAAPSPPSDQRIVDLWLHGRPQSTVKTYLEALNAFHEAVGSKPLRTVTLADLQAHDVALAGLAPATRAKRLAAIKSLFSFASKTGYLPLDPARALRLPKRPDRLAERILEESVIPRIWPANPTPAAG